MPGKILKTLFLSKLCLEMIALMSDRDVIKEVVKYRPKDAVDLVKKRWYLSQDPLLVWASLSVRKGKKI